MSFSQHVTWKKSSLFISVLLCSAAVRADLKEDLELSGSLRAAYWNKDKSFEPTDGFAVGSAWISLKPKEVSGVQFYFDGYVQGSDLSRNGLSYGDLREAYAEKSFQQFDVRIGRQIIVWGRADKFNPTDSFSTKDLKFLSTDDEDQRLGQFASQFKYNFEKIKLIALWQSEWRRPVYPVRSQPGISVSGLTPENQENQFGFKVDSSGGETDWSVSYFRGYNRVPDLKLLGTGAGIELGLNFAPIQVYGGDFARNIGDYGLRGEIAYTVSDDSSGDDPLKQNSFLQAVFGADRTVFENFNINLQILYKNISGFDDPGSVADANTRALAQRVATISNQKFKEQAGISIRPVYKMLNDTLESEVALVVWDKNGDSLIRPKITYAVNDNIRALAGGEFYNGPDDTLWGQLKDVSSSFLELRYLF